jgi:hypothetical protein
MRDGVSFSVAARRERLKPETFRRHAGKALRQKHPGSRLYAAPTDSLRREMQVQTDAGTERVVVRGLKQARLISAHANAIARFNRGDTQAIRAFEGKTIRVGRRTVRLLTDPAKLQALAEADAFTPDSLYD